MEETPLLASAHKKNHDDEVDDSTAIAIEQFQKGKLLSNNAKFTSNNDNNNGKKGDRPELNRSLFVDSMRGSFRNYQDLSLSTREKVGVAALLLRDAILDTADEHDNLSTNDNTLDIYNPYESSSSESSSSSSSSSLFLSKKSTKYFGLFSRKMLGRRTFVGLVHTAVYIILLLSFFEPPTWCNCSNKFIFFSSFSASQVSIAVQQKDYHTQLEDAQNNNYNPRLMTCEYLLTARGPPAFVPGGDDAVALDDTTANDNNSNANNMTVIENEEYYPNFHTMYLSSWESHTIEILFAMILVLYEAFSFGRDGCSIQRHFKIKMRIIRAASLFLLILALIIEHIIANSISFNDYDDTNIYRAYFIQLYQLLKQLNQYLRIILFIGYSKGIQREMTTVIRLMPIVFRIFVLFFIVLVFYSWVGVVLFYDTDEGKDHFSNLIEAMWTLWTCVTTANYPDVMMAAYNDNRLTTIFFVSFMIVEFYIAMNVILAVVVNFYSDEQDRYEVEKQDRTDKKIQKAYEILDKDQDGLVDRTVIMEIFPLLNEDCPEIKFVKTDTAELLFAILDKDGSNALTLEEFMDFGRVMLLEFESADNYMTFVECHFPKTFNSQWFQRLSNRVKSERFELFVDGILVLNAIVVAIQSYPELRGLSANEDPHIADGYIDTPWEIAETVFTLIYVVEMALKIIVYGWKSYINTKRNLFDFSITWLTLAATFYVYYPNAFSDSRLIRYVIMARVLRLFRVVIAMKQFRVIGHTIINIVPSVKRIFLLLFSLMYIFSIIGVNLYGGKICRDPSNPLSYKLNGTEFADNDYWANNFNDMPSGMNVLFNLLVINNWPEQASGFVAISNLWTRYFFVIFHICGVVIVSNLVVATLIDSFILEMQRNDDDDADDVSNSNRNDSRDYNWITASNNSMDAVITDDAGVVFDASEVTGTRTNVKGRYIARMRASHSNTATKRQMMRRLFTKSSSEIIESGRPSSHQD